MRSGSHNRWGHAHTMIIKQPDDISSSEITPEALYWNRRRFLGAAGAAMSGALVPSFFPSLHRSGEDDKPNSYDDITHYNNYYELGPDKRDPSENADRFHARPWSVIVEGEVHKPITLDIDDILKRYPAEERVYRLRCVEAWSMVIPWNGFALSRLLNDVQPTSQAKYVAFTTVCRPAEMPGQNTDILPLPYVEGLRLDEAMHPLTILVTGLYGKPLPNQDGAPIRLVVPWKYGFKGIKAIVRIRLTRTQPPTTWNIAAPDEYGFYANVNPNVDHPRWTQARERRLGEFLRRPTLMFNGYAEQVASLYAGMDLRANY